MSERGLRMDEWDNRRQWNMEVGRRRQTFENRTYIILMKHICITIFHMSIF